MWCDVMDRSRHGSAPSPRATLLWSAGQRLGKRTRAATCICSRWVLCFISERDILYKTLHNYWNSKDEWFVYLCYIPNTAYFGFEIKTRIWDENLGFHNSFPGTLSRSHPNNMEQLTETVQCMALINNFMSSYIILEVDSAILDGITMYFF